MRFDGPLLARAWLAVAAAAGTDKDHPLLYKTVAVEEHTTGVRLTATDRSVLLTVFVPDLDHHYDTAEPERALLPDRTIIAADVDGRARSFLGYVISLAARVDADDYTPGDVEVQVDFNARGPAAGQGSQPSFEGMDLTYLVLSTPDVEKVYIPVHEGVPVDWRPILDSFTIKRTTDLAYSPEVLERLGKIRKHAPGPVRLAFGGKQSPTRIEYALSDPTVWGVIMPARDDDPSEVECQTCADGAVCLKHSAGLITTGDLGGDLGGDDA